MSVYLEPMSQTEQQETILPRQFLRMCRANQARVKIADSSGAQLTGADLLTRALVVRSLLRREVLRPDESYVGLLLPPSVGGAVVNAALSIDRRIVVNLNYTMSSDVLNECLRQCGIRHVLTSRRAMERLSLQVDAELVYLEDFQDRIRAADKLAAAAAARGMPVAMLERRLGLHRIRPDDLLTVIFTSGSTGQPKGVMLTHRNVGSNVISFASALRLDRDDVLIGILPLFHSFGYTTTLWTALALDPKVVYHYSPLDARQIGKLCREHNANILIATPTFLRSYFRRCEPEDLASLEVVLTGAEKLPPELVNAYEQKFGARPFEGYGTTELSPVVSTNIPPHRTGEIARGYREGTVGQPIPGVAVKVVDLETGENLGPGRSGMLLVSGPNVMKGYLHRPDETAAVLRDGWYVTGDVAEIDADGFIRITGRVSRFSKIGGEMVPHVRVEEAIAQVLHLDEEEVRVVVSGVPDSKKGERLVVLHTGLSQAPDSVCRQLAARGLPPLWVPSPDSFHQVPSIPLLGSGKLDLKRVKELALDEFAD